MSNEPVTLQTILDVLKVQRSEIAELRKIVEDNHGELKDEAAVTRHVIDTQLVGDTEMARLRARVQVLEQDMTLLRMAVQSRG